MLPTKYPTIEVPITMIITDAIRIIFIVFLIMFSLFIGWSLLLLFLLKFLFEFIVLIFLRRFSIEPFSFFDIPIFILTHFIYKYISIATINT